MVHSEPKFVRYSLGGADQEHARARMSQFVVGGIK
jgi:hypothetical protein